MLKTLCLAFLSLVFVANAFCAEYCASAESRGLTSTALLTVGADYNVQTPLGAWWYLGVGYQVDAFEQCMDVSQEGTYWSDVSGITTVSVIGQGACDPPQVLGSFTLYQMVEPSVPCPDPDPATDSLLTRVITMTTIVDDAQSNLFTLIYISSLCIIFSLGYVGGVKS